MKPLFAVVYLRFAAAVLLLTALAKLWGIFSFMMSQCMEGEPLFGNFQPSGISNDRVLGFASGIELFIVLLICFSPWRWFPCLASALWGSICLIARIYFIMSGVDCGCLGWLAKPGPMTNIIASLLALMLALGGFKAFKLTWQKTKPLETSNIAPSH